MQARSHTALYICMIFFYTTPSLGRSREPFVKLLPYYGVKWLGLYNISEHQTAGPEVTVTPGPHGGGFGASENNRLRVRLWSARQSAPESRRQVRQLSPLHSLTHTNTAHIGTPYRFLPHSLCPFVFISRSLTVSHASTDPQVMTSHSDNKKIEKDHRMDWDSSFILLTQGLSELSLFTKGMQVQFLLLNESAFYTKSLKQILMSQQLPFVQPEVGFKRASCAKAKQKCFDVHLISPCC